MNSGVTVTLNIEDEDSRYIQTAALPRVGEEVCLTNNRYSETEQVHHCSDHYLVTRVVHHYVTGNAGVYATESHASVVFVTKIAT